jgi:hypothetical protein
MAHLEKVVNGHKFGTLSDFAPESGKMDALALALLCRRACRLANKE